ncbi:MAG: hypothetical protein R3B06_15870 [Kofleriaceae bacterium]
MSTSSTIARFRGVALAVVLAAGCGSDDVATPVTVTFIAGDASAIYLAVADGDGPWTQVPLSADAPATVTFTSAHYAFAGSCGYFDRPPFALAITRDAGAQATPVEICPGANTTLATIHGAVTPPTAVVVVGTLYRPLGPGATYATEAPTGTIDVVAVDTASPRMLVVRDVALTTDLTLDLDLSTGFDRVAVTPVASGLGAAAVTYATRLYTSNGLGQLNGTAVRADLVPAAARRAGDRLVVRAVASDGQQSRTVQHRVEADALAPFDFAPMPLLSADRAGAAWDAPHGDVTTLIRYTAGTTDLIVNQRMSPAYQDALGLTELPWIDPSTMPGWDPTWPQFPTGATLDWWVSVSDGPYDGELTGAVQRGTLVW